MRCVPQIRRFTQKGTAQRTPNGLFVFPLVSQLPWSLVMGHLPVIQKFSTTISELNIPCIQAPRRHFSPTIED